MKVRTFKEIVNSMVSWMKSNSSKLTNFYPGSVIRTMLEGVALEIENIYFQMHKGFGDAAEQAIFNSFNFSRKPPTASSGNVTVKFMLPLPQRFVISKGQKFSTVPFNGEVVYFESTADISCVEGNTSVVIPIICTQTGVIGNVGARTIRIAVTPIPFAMEIYNDLAFTNGRIEESREEVKKRFNQYIETLSKGTIAAVQYGCMSVEGVTGAYVHEGIGSIFVYAHDASGNLPDALKAKITENLLNYRSAGIEVTILPVLAKHVNVGITVTLAKGFDDTYYQVVITNSVISYLNSYTVSKNLARADLIRYIMAIDQNAVVNTDIDLATDIEVESNELIKAGTVNVTILQ